MVEMTANEKDENGDDETKMAMGTVITAGRFSLCTLLIP